MANTSLVAEDIAGYIAGAVVALVRIGIVRVYAHTHTHTRARRDRKWSRRRWPAFLRERVSLGMQRAHLYARARARSRALAHAVVERPFEGQGSRLSERRYIYATRPLPLLPLPYSRRPRCGAPACLPAYQRDLTRSRTNGSRNSFLLFGISRIEKRSAFGIGVR